MSSVGTPFETYGAGRPKNVAPDVEVAPITGSRYGDQVRSVFGAVWSLAPVLSTSTSWMNDVGQEGTIARDAHGLTASDVGAGFIG